MSEQAVLYVVATPIGNLADISSRAIEVLNSVDLIAAEDTRRSQILAQHFGIATPMQSYHDHSGDSVLDALLGRLQRGQSLALISDAGTPLISDPGFRLVDRALQAGIKVVPVPGACAAIAGLSAAGLASDRFCFEGFPAAKTQARRNQFALLKAEPRTLIYYEAPHRLLSCLRDMAEVFGPQRRVVLARELTKTFETIHRAALAELVDWVAADSNQQRGECVLLVEGAPVTTEITAEAERILTLLMAELPLKQAAKLAAEITGLKKNALYQHGLSLAPAR